MLIDTLASELSERADVVLPAATWAEKAGTFENVKGMLQSFEQAIPPREWVRAEGQIALDLAARAGLGEPRRFDAAAHWAERVRDAAPYDERAHRLAIVAHIDNADRAAARHAARVTQELLADLAVEPEQTTRTLLRQVTASQLV